MIIFILLFFFFVVYNTYPIASVIIQVVDENNNAPQFVYPQYPINPVELRMYFGAVANDSRPDRPVLDIYVSITTVPFTSSKIESIFQQFLVQVVRLSFEKQASNSGE